MRACLIGLRQINSGKIRHMQLRTPIRSKCSLKHIPPTLPLTLRNRRSRNNTLEHWPIKVSTLFHAFTRDKMPTEASLMASWSSWLLITRYIFFSEHKRALAILEELSPLLLLLWCRYGQQPQHHPSGSKSSTILDTSIGSFKSPLKRDGC